MENTETQVPFERPRGRFTPGQGRVPGSGRPKGSTSRKAKLRDFGAYIASRMGSELDDPAKFLIYITLTGRDPLHFPQLFAKTPFRYDSKDQAEIALKLAVKQAAVEGTEPPAVPVEGKDYPVELMSRVECAAKAGPFFNPKMGYYKIAENDEDMTPAGDAAEHAKTLSANPRIRELFETVQKEMALADMATESESVS